MHYNLKVEIERVRSEYVTQIEVASVGRAGRKRLVSPTFEQAIADLTAAHDELLGHVADYHKASAPPAAAPEVKVKAPAKAQAGPKKSPKGKGAPAKPAVESIGSKFKKAAKQAVRKFASE